jgi:hypothetical protein
MIVDHIIWEATVPSQSYNNENFASAGTGENTEKQATSRHPGLGGE